MRLWKFVSAPICVHALSSIVIVILAMILNDDRDRGCDDDRDDARDHARGGAAAEGVGRADPR